MQTETGVGRKSREVEGRLDSIRGGNGVVLMHNAPLPIELLQAHGEPEIQAHSLSAAQVAACADSRDERNVAARGYGDVAEIELNGFFLHIEKWSPGRHVGVDAARQERWRYVEHKDVGVVVGAYRLIVAVADRLRPPGDQIADFGFIVLRCHHSF